MIRLGHVIASSTNVMNAFLDQVEHEEAAGEREFGVIGQTLAHFRQYVQHRGCQEDTGAKAKGTGEQQSPLQTLHARDEEGGRDADEEATGADQQHRRQLRLYRVSEHYRRVVE